MLDYYIKSGIKNLSSPVIDKLGVYDRIAGKNASLSSGWLIAMYHRVVRDPQHDPFHLGMCVQERNFAEQIAYLGKHFRALRLGDAVDLALRDGSLPERALSVSFDDGYLDNLTHALPVLQQFEVPMTLFVATGGLDQGSGFWWDRTIDAFAATERTHVDLMDIGLSERSDVLSLGWTVRRRTVTGILERLWELPLSTALERVETLRGYLGSPPEHSTGGRRLNTAQIVDLHRQGVEIAAHTVNHPNLTRLSVDEVREEIAASKRYLEDLLDAEIRGFAFPAGRFDDMVMEAARAARFSYIASTESGTNIAPYDLNCLRRIGVPDARMADLKRSLCRIR
jgi:peptidoglycan/xylan/chitin deacetylase (PgdA/CDA1 family)